MITNNVIETANFNQEYPVVISTSPAAASNYWGACFSLNIPVTAGTTGTTCTSIPAGTSSATATLPSGSQLYLCTGSWYGTGGYSFTGWYVNGQLVSSAPCQPSSITTTAGTTSIVAEYQAQPTVYGPGTYPISVLPGTTITVIGGGGTGYVGYMTDVCFSRNCPGEKYFSGAGGGGGGYIQFKIPGSGTSEIPITITVGSGSPPNLQGAPFGATSTTSTTTAGQSSEVTGPDFTVTATGGKNAVCDLPLIGACNTGYDYPSLNYLYPGTGGTTSYTGSINVLSSINGAGGQGGQQASGNNGAGGNGGNAGPNVNAYIAPLAGWNGQSCPGQGGATDGGAGGQDGCDGQNGAAGGGGGGGGAFSGFGVVGSCLSYNGDTCTTAPGAGGNGEVIVTPP